MTNPELQDHLYSLEERLLHPDRERDRTALIPLFSEEFKEFCISGRIFNRHQVIDALLKSAGNGQVTYLGSGDVTFMGICINDTTPSCMRAPPEAV